MIQILKQYLIDNDGSLLLQENSQTGALTDKSRKRLINKSTNLLVKLFGPYPSKIQRTKMAKAIIIVFPFLETKNSMRCGIVSFSNVWFGYIWY